MLKLCVFIKNDRKQVEIQQSHKFSEWPKQKQDSVGR